MKNGRKALALGLSFLLLSGCGVQPVELPPGEAEVPIAYVPLDDRPDNVERVAYLAESLGYQLKLPEEDDYRTRLDHQPKNQNGTQSGDRGGLYQWVLAQEEQGCDRYVLSLDQLLSGGLVHSRAMQEREDLRYQEEGETISLSEDQALETLLETLAEDPENEVWLLESVMRLAPTVGYQGGTMEDYEALRSYAALPRPTLSGEELNQANVEACYRLGQEGTAIPRKDFGLREDQLTGYLAARSRKLELSTKMLQLVEEMPQVHVLIGIDDSSVAESIQKNEIAYLRSLLREGDALLSGVDDLAFKAVAKLYLEESGWEGAKASVRYFGGTEDRPACAYDSQALETIVQEHLDFFQLKETQREGADLEILVLTQPAEPQKQVSYYVNLVQAMEENREQHLPTILIDAGNGRYGTDFHEELTRETELGWLLSYAGFLDMAIVTGTALSHGVARYAFLLQGERTEVTERAFAQTLADSVLKDFCYKHVVREELIPYVQELGGDPNNFYDPEVDRIALASQLEERMEKSTKKVLRNLEQSDLIVSLAPYEELGWGEIQLGNYRFPWERIFEIGMDVAVDGFTTPHTS